MGFAKCNGQQKYLPSNFLDTEYATLNQYVPPMTSETESHILSHFSREQRHKNITPYHI
jgi:hypothetical protein